MLWRFLKKDKDHWATFRLAKMAHETGAYKHKLDNYEIVPLANNTELTNTLPTKHARARHDIIVNELPERASRFSNYLHSINTDVSLDGLQNWITLTAELSDEPGDQDKRPKRLRPRLRAMHFDAACFAHTLTVIELVQNNQSWNEGFAGDAPLFQSYQNIPVFPVLWLKTEANVHVNMHQFITQLAGGILSDNEQMVDKQQIPLSQWLAELNKTTPALKPVEQLKQWWEVEFLEDNGYLPEFNDLMEMAQSLRIHADDVPKYIMQEATKRSAK